MLTVEARKRPKSYGQNLHTLKISQDVDTAQNGSKQLTVDVVHVAESDSDSAERIAASVATAGRLRSIAFVGRLLTGEDELRQK